MASSVPWELTQLKTEYGFLEFPHENTAICQGQGVSARACSQTFWTVGHSMHPVAHPSTARKGLMGGVDSKHIQPLVKNEW